MCGSLMADVTTYDEGKGFKYQQLQWVCPNKDCEDYGRVVEPVWVEIKE